jgi:cobalt-zinc-cadmium efflux system protein
MGHDHGHHHGGVARSGARHVRPLRLALALIAGFLAVQVVVGLATSSLAVLSDAGHMATDAFGLGMALAAISAASRASRDGHRTFGLYRLEILAALANSVLLVGVGGFVVIEAFHRLDDPQSVASTPVLIVGIVGLAVNVAAFLLLRRGATENLNVRGAYLEVVGDALGSVGVIASAIGTAAFGWRWVDPVVGAAIGVFILPRAVRLGRDALRVLVQAAPHGIDVDDVRSTLTGIAGVTDVHDLHVWTLTSEMDVLTAHLVVDDAAAAQRVLDDGRRALAERFHLDHATLQVEVGPSASCQELSW